LSSEDRYLLLMAGEAAPWFTPEAPSPAPKSRWMAALAAAVVFGILLYIEMRFVAPDYSSFAVVVLPLMVCPILSYFLVRWLIGDE
jgi:antibiotic biosynthesis monooxygenase (ABM) superfamily enzyme